MSWTTENDPPPPRPTASGPETDSEPTSDQPAPDLGASTKTDDVSNTDLSDEVGERTDTSDPSLSHAKELTKFDNDDLDNDDLDNDDLDNDDLDNDDLDNDDLDESGGLDPSVFDGLFDDLIRETESESETSHQTDDPSERSDAGDEYGEQQATDRFNDEGLPGFVADDSEFDEFRMGDVESDGTQSTEIDSADAESADTESTSFESTDPESTDAGQVGTGSTGLDSTDLDSTDLDSTDVESADAESADVESNEFEADETGPAEIRPIDTELLSLDYRSIPVSTGDDFAQDDPIDVGSDRPDPIDKYFSDPRPSPTSDSSGADDRWSLPSTPAVAEQAYVGEQYRVVNQPEIRNRQQDYEDRGPAVQLRVPAEARSRPRRRANWAGILAAVTIGSVLGLVGTFLISNFRDSNGDTAGEGQPNQGVAPSEAGLQGQDGTSVEPGTQDGQAPNSESVVQPFGLSAVQFGDGTPNLTEEDRLALDQLAELLDGTPEAAATVTVRSYAADSAAANYELSVTQSNAISQYLTGRGVTGERLAVSARGAAPFSPSQPVNGFVVVNPGIGQTSFKSALGQLNPFVIGLEPGTSNLREESLTALERVGKAMSAVETAEITLASYSYTESGTETNKARAAQAAQVASLYLQTAHAIDGSRIATIAAGNVPYKMDPEWGSHVEIRVEEDTRPAFNISSLDSSQLTFEPNSSRLSFEARAFLDQVGNALGSSNATLVIDVFSYASADAQVNDQLSKAQAQAITDYLASKDVSGLEARFSGSGSSPQFEGVGAPTVIALTVIR